MTLTISCQPRHSVPVCWYGWVHQMTITVGENPHWIHSAPTVTYSNQQTTHSGAALVTLTISCQPCHGVPVCWYGLVHHMIITVGGEILYWTLTPIIKKNKALGEWKMAISCQPDHCFSLLRWTNIPHTVNQYCSLGHIMDTDNIIQHSLASYNHQIIVGFKMTGYVAICCQPYHSAHICAYLWTPPITVTQ